MQFALGEAILEISSAPEYMESAPVVAESEHILPTEICTDCLLEIMEGIKNLELRPCRARGHAARLD